MALIDEVKARFGEQYLVNISNPYDETATTIDDTRLGKACTDVEADFETFGQVEFDASEPQHVSLAVAGVEMKLLVWGGHEPSSKWDSFVKDKLENGLAPVTSRSRVPVTTSSTLVPSTEQRGIDEPKPYFDERKFDYLIPGAPSTGEDDALD